MCLMPIWDVFLFRKSSLWGCLKPRHVTSPDVFLLAAIRYRIQAVGYNGACMAIIINRCHEISKV